MEPGRMILADFFSSLCQNLEIFLYRCTIGTVACLSFFDSRYITISTFYSEYLSELNAAEYQ